MREDNKPYHRIKEYTRTAHQTGDDRIRELQVPLEKGMVWVGEGEVQAELISELLRFPYGAHDDLITLLAYMYSQQVKPKKEKKKRDNVIWLNGPQSFKGTGIKNWMAM